MKKNTFKLLNYTFTLFLLFICSCSTEETVSNQTLQAQTWFKKYEAESPNFYLFQNLEYNWNSAKLVSLKDGTQTIIVPVIGLKKSQSEIWEQKLYIYNQGTNNYKALVFEIYPDKNTSLAQQSIEGNDFTGFISTWDLKTGLIRAAEFKDNQVVQSGGITVKSKATGKMKNLTPPCFDEEGNCAGGGGSTDPVPLREVIVTNNSNNNGGGNNGYENLSFSGGGSSYNGNNTDSFVTYGGGGGSNSVNNNHEDCGPGYRWRLGKCEPIYKVIDSLTGKAKCIYDKLKNSSTGFDNAIKKFDGEFSVSHLKLTINNGLETNVYGITLPPVNYITEVQISNNAIGTLSDLGRATVFVHEIIHAEIFRKMLSAAQRGTLDSKTPAEQTKLVESLKDNFSGLYDYYEKRYKPTWNHEMMASHYRSTIADIIQEFDNNRSPRSTYEAIAWVGLGVLDKEKGLTTIAWDNLTPSQKTDINILIRDNFYNGPKNCN